MSRNQFRVGLGLLALIAGTAACGAGEPANWSGLYFGGHAGYLEPDTDTSPFDMSGFAGGVHLGYNAQSGIVVGGVEVDYTWTDVGDTETIAVPIPASFKIEMDDIASVRGRLGIAHDNWLFYGTVGYAWSELVATASAPLFGVSSTEATDMNGIVGGGGVELWLAPAVSARVEGLYYDLDVDNDSDDFAFGVVRAGLTIHAPR